MMRRIILPLLVLALGLAGCKDNDATGPTPIEEEVFAEELEIDLGAMTRTNSGLYLQDLQVGDGEVAEAGDHVTAHYTGWLVDGTEFDSSAGRDPIGFPLGAGVMIRGWDEGLEGMAVGGERKLVIPSNLAYGARGRGVVPPHATLVFTVHLVGVTRPGGQ